MESSALRADEAIRQSRAMSVSGHTVERGDEAGVRPRATRRAEGLQPQEIML